MTKNGYDNPCKMYLKMNILIKLGACHCSIKNLLGQIVFVVF
ncbi:hypothetical protein AO372_0406 [Moraxella catarrhalis]|nr:hypothetical protein AO372_0406 [Moraxella catarrhalis]